MENKKRLIDADGAKRRVIAFATGCHSEVISVEAIVMMLNQEETIDAVEVVRCKDCKYWEYGKDYEPYCNHWKSGMADTVEDDFCSYGERKDND